MACSEIHANGNAKLTFRELGSTTRFAETVLLAFHFTGVTGKQALFAKDRFDLGIEILECARYPSFFPP